MSETARKSSQRKLRANEQKWGLSLVDAGWTMLPSTILAYQKELGLDPIDMNILLQLAQYWWKHDNPPHPSIRSISARIGRSMSTVQRRISKMKRAGLIGVENRFHERHKGQTTSVYTFDGLIERATIYANQTLQRREAARANRSTPRPDLRVAEGTTPTA